MSITCVTIILALLSFATTASINNSVSKVDLKEGDNVDITTAISYEEGENLVYLKLLFNDMIIAQDTGNSFSLTVYAIRVFGNRVSCSVSGFKYKLSIASLYINDSVILRVQFLYLKPNNAYGRNDSEVSINVNADPTILSFPELLYVKEGETLAFETTIYGKPKPVSIIKLPERTYEAKSSTETQNNTYKFVYDLDKITANDCGMVLQLNVSGNGKVINRSSTVRVQFTPPMLTEVSVVQLLDFSVKVKWKPIISGKCYVLYNVEFLNSTNQVVYRYVLNNPTEVSTTNFANATSVKLYAVVNGSIGEYFIQGIPPPQIAVTKAPYSNLFVVGAAVGAAAICIGIMFVALVTYSFAFLRRRKATKEEIKVDQYNQKDRNYQNKHPVLNKSNKKLDTENYYTSTPKLKEIFKIYH